MTIRGTANVGLDSSVGKSAGTSNQRSQVQPPAKSNFLCSSEIKKKMLYNCAEVRAKVLPNQSKSHFLKYRTSDRSEMGNEDWFADPKQIGQAL